MEFDVQTGLLTGARFVESPNADERPDRSVPEVIVVHAISLPPGEFGGDDVERFFCNRLDVGAHPYYREITELKVSSHFFVRRDGRLVQFVPTTRRAWHAGRSCCEGRERANDFSIGIELEGTNAQEFESAQYDRLVALTRSLIRAYPAINRRRVYAHQDIAPQRKTDPGPAFDWAHYLSQLPTEPRAGA